MQVIDHQISELLELGTNPYRISLMLGVAVQQVIEIDTATHIDRFCGVELTGYRTYGDSEWGNLDL